MDDTQQLEKMDEQADEAIANWSLGALVVNMLPPPFVHKALGKVLVEISEDLSEIYAVERDSPVLKELAGAMADDLRAAYETEPDVTHSHLDRLKYIPGINIWVGLMMQPRTVAAVTHSIGYAFKQYFHAQKENRTLEPAEVAKIAATSFLQTLTDIGQSGDKASEVTESPASPLVMRRS